MSASSSFEETHSEFLKDPEQAALYLSETALDGSVGEVLAALRQMVQVKGIKAVAAAAGLNRESLYRTFDGNPKLDTLVKILDSLEIQLSFMAKTESERVIEYRYEQAERADTDKVETTTYSQTIVVVEDSLSVKKDYPHPDSHWLSGGRFFHAPSMEMSETQVVGVHGRPDVVQVHVS